MNYINTTITTMFSVIAIIASVLLTPTVNASELKINNNEKIYVYYFHGNRRCATCMKIEELTEKAVKNTFGDNYNDHNVVYKAINVEESTNEHFITDYQLMVKCVVIAKEEQGKETAWKRLDKVWNYHSDQNEFFTYFTDNIQKLLAEK